MEKNKIIKEVFILSNKLKRLLDKKHSKNGISSGQARLLSFLYRHQDQVLFQKDIEKEFQIRRGSVTGIVDNLEQNKYVIRESCAKDKRKNIIKLTDLGIEFAKKSIETVIELESDLSNLLTKDEKDLFNNIMIKIDNWTNMEEENEKSI